MMPLPPTDKDLLRIMDQVFSDVACRAGLWLACRPGCTQCCHGAFPIHALDALRLQGGLTALRAADPARAAAVEARAARWMEEHGADFPGHPQTGLLGQSDEERERFEDFADEAACPALDLATGLCDLYDSRPMTCRVFGPPVRVDGGVACCELCFQGAAEEVVAACAMEPPHTMEEDLAESLGRPGETVVAFALLGRLLPAAR